MAERIQQRRTRGWRKPENAVSVARPSRCGNPFRVEHVECSLGGFCYRVTRAEKILHEHIDHVRDAHELAVSLYRTALVNGNLPYGLGEVRAHLRGRDLMCFCALSQPCHGDVLLELAERRRDG